MDNPESDGNVSNDRTGGEDDAGEFVAMDLDLEADRTMNAMLSPGHHARDRSVVDD